MAKDSCDTVFKKVHQCTICAAVQQGKSQLLHITGISLKLSNCREGFPSGKVVVKDAKTLRIS